MGTPIYCTHSGSLEMRSRGESLTIRPIRNILHPRCVTPCDRNRSSEAAQAMNESTRSTTRAPSTERRKTTMNATTDSGVKQTIVLVHGAYADSSSWNGSINALREAGHPVIAVANPLRGLESDAEYLRSVLDSIDGPIVIAGHSYGGYIMSHAAEGNPNVTALVFVASFLAEPGESLADLVGKFPGAELGSAAQPVPYPTPDGG